MAQTLDRKLKDVAERLQAAAQIVVAADEHMSATDVRIEWENGAIERNTEQLWEMAQRAIDDLVASADYTTDMHMDNLQQTLKDNPTTPPETKE